MMNKKRQCYPLCFIRWRLIKSDSVTFYVLFEDNRYNAVAAGDKNLADSISCILGVVTTYNLPTIHSDS